MIEQARLSVYYAVHCGLMESIGCKPSTMKGLRTRLNRGRGVVEFLLSPYKTSNPRLELLVKLSEVKKEIIEDLSDVVSDIRKTKYEEKVSSEDLFLEREAILKDKLDKSKFINCELSDNLDGCLNENIILNREIQRLREENQKILASEKELITINKKGLEREKEYRVVCNSYSEGILPRMQRQRDRWVVVSCILVLILALIGVVIQRYF